MGTITYWNMPNPGARPIFEAPLSEDWEGPIPRMLVQKRGVEGLSMEQVRWFGRRIHLAEIEVSAEIEEDLFNGEQDWVENTKRINRWAHQAAVRLQEERFDNEDIHVVFRQPPHYFGDGGGGKTGLLFIAAVFDRMSPVAVEQADIIGTPTPHFPPMLEAWELREGRFAAPV